MLRLFCSPYSSLDSLFSQDERAWEDKSQITRALKCQTRLARLEKQISSYHQLRTAVSDVRELAGISHL
jgi:hypothetical protein